jgi:hypothetical protein
MLPTTWFYVSSIIVLTVFFRFNRFWSVRNLDIFCIILLTPGLLLLAMPDTAGQHVANGYTWFFAVQSLLAVRLFFDFVMIRRPFLDPNLSSSGLAFSCFFLVFFLIAALIVNRGNPMDTVRTVRLEQILTARHIHTKFGMNPDTLTVSSAAWENMPPGFRPFLVLTERANLVFAASPKIQNEIVRSEEIQPVRSADSKTADFKTDILKEEIPAVIGSHQTEPVSLLPPPAAGNAGANTANTAAQHPPLGQWVLITMLIIAGHLSVVLALIYIGYRHFGNFQTGISCAMLYLLHPYANQMIARLDHVLPAALILGSVAFYRRPFFSGLGIGVAAALVFYPLWLIPLWCSFYQQKGLFRFLTGTVAATAVFSLLLLFSPPQYGTFFEQLFHMAGKTALLVFGSPEGFWKTDDMFFRLPVIAVFGTVCFGMFAVPQRKNLAALIAGSALLMIGVQFWQIYQGGLYMAWYLPLLILTIFRPNLEDRIARSSVT